MIDVKIQTLANIEKANNDKTNIKKMMEGAVANALVIGNDEFGVPIVMSRETLKTYLFETTDIVPGDYLKNEITIVYEKDKG